MENITKDYLARAEMWLLISMLLYFLMNGAQVFETVVFVPKWSANPPQTLKMLTDVNGSSLKVFWITLHSLHEITFILAIIFCWQIVPAKYWLLMLFVIHFAIRIWTIAYFAPNIIDFQTIAETSILGAGLSDRIARWQMLNYVRVAIYIVVSCGLIPIYLRLLHFGKSF